MNQPVSGISISSVIHGAFSFVFGSIPALIKAALIPALINLAAVAIIFFILNPMFSSVGNIVSLLVSVAFAASWNRSTLLGHGSPRTGLGFFFGWNEALYLWRFILVFLAAFVPMLLLVWSLAFFGAQNGLMGFGFLGFAIGAVIAVYLYARLSLALPAAAIGHGSFTLASSWAATRQAAWSLFWCHVCLFLIMGLINIIVYFLIASVAFGVGGLKVGIIVIAIMLPFLTLFFAAMGTSALSWIYGQLDEKPDWVQ